MNTDYKGVRSLARAWFFNDEEKPRSRVEIDVKRDASRNAFATKRRGKIIDCVEMREFAEG